MDHSPGFLKIVDDAKSRIKEISLKDVFEKIKRGDAFHLVDTREDGEWGQYRIPNAVHIGKGVIERDIEKKIPDKTADIVFYCGGGFRSALAADALRTMGYSKVTSMMEGIRGWKTAGYPIDEKSL